MSKLFTVLFPDNDNYSPDSIAVMITLDHEHIELIEAARRLSLKGLVSIVVSLCSGLRPPEITFLEDGFQKKKWSDYKEMFAKIDADGSVSLGITYEEVCYGIEMVFAYYSYYEDIAFSDVFIADEFRQRYLDLDTEELAEMKKHLSEEDYIKLKSESLYSEGDLLDTA